MTIVGLMSIGCVGVGVIGVDVIATAIIFLDYLVAAAAAVD